MSYPSGYTVANQGYCYDVGNDNNDEKTHNYLLKKTINGTETYSVWIEEGARGYCGSCQKGDDSDNSGDNTGRCTKSDTSTDNGGPGCNNSYDQCNDCLCDGGYCGCYWDTSDFNSYSLACSFSDAPANDCKGKSPNDPCNDNYGICVATLNDNINGSTSYCTPRKTTIVEGSGYLGLGSELCFLSQEDLKLKLCSWVVYQASEQDAKQDFYNNWCTALSCFEGSGLVCVGVSEDDDQDEDEKEQQRPKMQFRRADELRAGDAVYSPSLGKLVTITATTRGMRPSGERMYRVNGLLFTSLHPLKLPTDDDSGSSGDWYHPKDVGEVVVLEEPIMIYNFVVSDGGTMHVNDLTVLTLGDNAAAGYAPVHPYWGTSKVVDDLRARPDWPDCIKAPKAN
tara:strand:+ start:2160 stop:3347 length:1188 start_codon:yes stop_codon:yes gene_type:complete